MEQDELKDYGKRNMIFVVVLLLVIIVITLVSSSGSDPLVFNSDNMSLTYTDDDGEFQTVAFLYTDIESAEYLDYIPEETMQNASLSKGEYLGVSVYDGEPCYCWLNTKVEAACVVRTSDIVLVFNDESADTTEQLVDELLELSQGEE